MKNTILIFFSFLFLVSCGYTKLIPVSETEANKQADKPLSKEFANYSKLLFHFGNYGENENNSKLTLYLSTVDKYGCSGNQIVTENLLEGENINIKIIGVKKPINNCLAVMAKASAKIDLKYHIGDFKLNFFLKDTVNTYQLKITPTHVFIYGDTTELTSY